MSPMLFILIIDVLNSLIMKAAEQGLLQPILRNCRGRRLSLYADHVVPFLWPRVEEVTLIKEILKNIRGSIRLGHQPQ